MVLNYKGYVAIPEYSADDRIFYGKILGIRDMVYFQSENTKDLKDEFHKAVDDYLAFCMEIGKAPQREQIAPIMVTVPGLEADPDKYMELAQLHDVLIVRDGKVVAKLIPAESRTGSE